MLRILILIGLIIWFPSWVSAQMTEVPVKAKKEWIHIEQLLNERKYEEAQTQLERLVTKYPQFLSARKLLAQSYLSAQDYLKADRLITETIENLKVNEKSWWLMAAESSRQLKDYLRSIDAWEHILQLNKLSADLKKLAVEKIAELQDINHLVQNPVPFNPINLGPGVNTIYEELYPFISPDGEKMYFTRKIEDENLYVAQRLDSTWGNATLLPFNTVENEGAQSVSSNGSLIFFTACNRPEGMGSCDIFYTMLYRGQWTKPGGIGMPINSPYWESQPFITSDNNALIFSSNRPGGLGGSDLYISYLDANNHWSIPQNLGAQINTSGNEETPFLHADGKTLYFSSTGHHAIGGKDIFVSKKMESGEWSKPKNLGYPINTEKDEFGLFVALDGKSAYMSSSRDGGLGKMDIYRFDLQDSVSAEAATYVKAVVKDESNHNPLSASYAIYDFETNHLYARGTTGNNGQFLIAIPASKTYRLEVEKSSYLFYSEQFKPQAGSLKYPFLLDIYLSPIRQGASVILNNVLFKTDSYELEETSYPELSKLVDLLRQNPNLKASINGYTDNVGTAAYNLELSRKRAQAVVDFLIQNGVNPTRLSAQGWGDTNPVAPNDTEVNRHKNRRTEFVILSN